MKKQQPQRDLFTATAAAETSKAEGPKAKAPEVETAAPEAVESRKTETPEIEISQTEVEKIEPETIDFPYRLDRRARRTTWITAGVIVVAITLLWLLSPASYLPAWFSSITFAVGVLATLSIPRRIRVTDHAIEIRCVVEITHITYRRLKEIRRVELSEFKPFIPIFGSPGFGGYFGYWLTLGGWDLVKVYTSKRVGLVMIEDLYEQCYLVSVDEPEKLIEAVNLRKNS